MLVGSYYANHLAGRIPRTWAERAVDLVLRGLSDDTN
jgi:hypothetical protein